MPGTRSLPLSSGQAARKTRTIFDSRGHIMRFARAGFAVIVILSALGGPADNARAQDAPIRFHLMEATIPDVHRAIQEGQITCRGLVQAYVNRARAYNGV